MSNPWFKSATFPCVIGMVYILGQIILMSFVDTLLGLGISFLVCAALSLWLLFIGRSYTHCGFLVTTICGVAAVVVLLDFLMDMQVGIENKTFYLLAVNWFAPTLVCSFARLIDRKRRIDGFEVFFRVASIVFFAIYILSLVAILFFGSVSRGNGYYGVNFVPLKTINMYLTTTVLSQNDKILNLAGNVLLFVPLGFYLSVFSHRLHFLLRLFILLLVPVGIEALQHLFHTGAADVDDVILNVTGGLLGMFVCFLSERIFRRFHKNKDARFFCFKK